jgi:hypothetical protein
MCSYIKILSVMVCEKLWNFPAEWQDVSLEFLPEISTLKKYRTAPNGSHVIYFKT